MFLDCDNYCISPFVSWTVCLVSHQVVRHDNIRDHLCQTLLTLIRRERKGEVVDRYFNVHINTIHMIYFGMNNGR